MGAFTTERTAHVQHRCWRCGGWIKPGERYKSTNVTPGGDLGYERWTRFAEHLSYAECDGVLADVSVPDVPDWLGGSDWPETPVTKEA